MTSTSRKIFAGVLSLAMVLTLVAGVASSASAQTTVAATYTRNLTVGSTGADVTALQSTLYAAGYLKVAPTGYFGSLTKAALAAWQASVGISPASGYFGPITRAYLATMGTGTSTVPGCTPGAMYSSTTGQPCTTTGTLPAGCTSTVGYSTTTGQPCSTGSVSTGTLDNMDGSIVVAASTVVPSTVTIKKGETKDLIAAKLTASVGKVAVTRFDVRFNERPWLTFNKFELVDNNTGAVVATKNISGASDFTEVTVGSDYLLRFDNLNTIVTPGTDTVLKVRGTLMTSSDKITGQTVTVTLPASGIRTINGKGYTDSIGAGNTASVTLSTTGSNANIVVRGNSANASRIVTTSTTGQTNDVTLGMYDFKSENQASTINTLQFTMANNKGSSTVSIFKSVKLTDGSTTYYASTIGTTTIFTNLNISLPLDSYKTLTLKADVADQDEFTPGTIASSSIVANTTNVVGVDVNYNSLSVNGGNTVSGQDVTLTSAGATVAVGSVSTNAIDNGSSATVKYGVTMSYTLSNTSSNDLYVSAKTFEAVATSTTASSSSFTLMSASGTNGNDVAGSYYVVPAGSSRTFTLSGVIDNTNGTSGAKEFKITAIRFSDTVSDLTKSSINFGIDALRAVATF